MSSLLPGPATAGNLKKSPKRFAKWKRTQPIRENNPNILEPSGQLNHGFPTTTIDDEVMEVVKMHKCFRIPSIAPDIEVTDLPNLDDLTEYDVSEEIQERLWAKEVSRLATAATSKDPLGFKGSQDLAVDSKKSYGILTALADQVYQSMAIVIYDGQNVLAKHSKGLCEVDTMKNSRRILDYICNKEEEDKEGKDKAEVRGSREDFFNFVDYCTAVLARVIFAAADGKSLHIKFLAHLAKISTKLKIVSAKPQEFSQTSIDNSVADPNILIPDQYGIRERQGSHTTKTNSGSSQELDQIMDPMLESLRAMKGGHLAPLEPSSKKDSMKGMYFMECTKFRTAIVSFLRILAISLRGTNQLMRTSLNSYEICAMVYETGFERFRTLVFQDLDNDILGNSDPSSINCARSAFHVLDQAVRHVHNQIKSVSTHDNGDNSGPSSSQTVRSTSVSTNSNSSSESVGTQLTWSYVPDEPGIDRSQDPERLFLHSMCHVITTIIPLIMASPIAVRSLSHFITMAIFAEFQSERQQNPIKPRAYGKYSAFFCLTTKEYVAEQHNRPLGAPKSLSSALMRRRNLLSGKYITDIGRAISFGPGASIANELLLEDSETTLGRIQRHQWELDNVSNQIKRWVFEEKGVMVRCRFYVCTVMLLCTTLVVGGISIGLSVENRITGVDPFNVTTYCWVLAAFSVLFAKSIRVQNWPWNDFLHGRVLCKSVSELSSVTRINEQLILAKLLQDESISFLQTRGPYNTVFRRKSEDGFSIDRPLSTWTMLLSGLIMIEVEGSRGRGLVVLDLRRGTKFKIIENLGTLDLEEESELIHCELLPEKDDETHGGPRRIRLKMGSMSWMHALGFYGNENAEFI